MKPVASWLAIVWLLVPAAAGAKTFGTSPKGTSTAQFLSLGVGARGISMGEAYTAFSDGSDSLDWNPAGLTRIQRGCVTAAHAPYIGSSSIDYGSYGQRFGPVGFATGIKYFSPGRIDERDAAGEKVGDFTPRDLAVSIGAAWHVWDHAIGFSGKFIESVLLDSARTAAIDAGLLSRGYLNGRLRLGLALLNLGKKIRFEEKREKLPLTLKAGSVVQIGRVWHMTVDGSFPRDNSSFSFLAIGTECLIRKSWGSIAGRAGFNSRSIGDVDALSGLSVGFGVMIRSVCADYAVVPMGELGATHHFTLGLKY